MEPTNTSYPLSFSVDYPDRGLDRMTSFFRIFTVIPIAIVLALLVGATFGASEGQTSARYASGGLLALPTVLMILFRRKYPRWWFDWNIALLGFMARVWAYVSLLRDEYPSTDEEQAVHLAIPYPDAKNDLNQWLPLVKWFLAIPHYIVLLFLGIASFVCVVIAWFAILFTGRYPRSLFDFVVSVERWNLRVVAYAFVLTTDQYPPFSLSA